MTPRRIAITAADCYEADAPMPGDLDADSIYDGGVPHENEEQEDDMADVFEDEDDLDEDDDIAPYERTPLEDEGDDRYEQERDR